MLHGTEEIWLVSGRYSYGNSSVSWVKVGPKGDLDRHSERMLWWLLRYPNKEKCSGRPLPVNGGACATHGNLAVELRDPAPGGSRVEADGTRMGEVAREPQPRHVPRRRDDLAAGGRRGRPGQAAPHLRRRLRD